MAVLRLGGCDAGTPGADQKAGDEGSVRIPVSTWDLSVTRTKSALPSPPMVKRFFLPALSLTLLATVLPSRFATAEQLDQLPRPSVAATIIANAPTLDGDVLNDPAWSSVTPTRDFLQQNPDTGQPASQRTEIPNRSLTIKYSYLFELPK